MSSSEYGRLDCPESDYPSRPAGNIFGREDSVKNHLEFRKERNDWFEHMKFTNKSSFSCGNSSQVSVPVAELINPKPKSRFQEDLFEKRELCYQSKVHPLGKTRKSTTFKGSKDMPDSNKLYGISTILDDPAGKLINPRKTEEQVLKETEKGHQNYIVSHNAFYPGEMVDRKYNWKGRIPNSIKFGKPTPHCNDGKNMAHSLRYWNKDSHLVSKNYDDYRARYQPVLTKTLDPIAESRKLNPKHTFGAVEPPAECGVGDLIVMRKSDFLARKDMKRRWLACLREQLMQANYHNFNDLKSAFKLYDPQNTGYINADHLHKVCWTFNLPVDEKLLSYLSSILCKCKTRAILQQSPQNRLYPVCKLSKLEK